MNAKKFVPIILILLFFSSLAFAVDINANNIHFSGTISGGDFNYSLADANGSITAPTGFALSSIGPLIQYIQVPLGTITWANVNQYLVPAGLGGIQDSNVSNDITVNWNGLQNYPSDCPTGQFVTGLGDTLMCSPYEIDWNALHNYPSDCPIGEVVTGVGDTLTCMPVDSTFTGDFLGTPNQIDVEDGENKLAGTDVIIRGPQDLNTTSSPTFNNLILTNGSSTIALLPSFNVLAFANPLVDGAIATSSPNLTLQSSDGTGDIVVSSFNSIRPIVDDAASLGEPSINFSAVHAYDANILDTVHTKKIVCTDAATPCLNVSGDQFVFMAGGTGMFVDLSPRSVSFESNGTSSFRSYIGSGNIGTIGIPARTTNPTGSLTPGMFFSKDVGGGDYALYQYTQSTFHQVGSTIHEDFTAQQNALVGGNLGVIGGIQSNHNGGSDCFGSSSLTPGTPSSVTVSTTCIRNDSLVYVTNNQIGSSGVWGSYAIGTRASGTSFQILSNNSLDDSNVSWMIVNKI